MKIAVCLKQVISHDAPLAIDKTTQWIREGELPQEVNEPDQHALELALQYKDDHGATITVVSVGSDKVVTTLRDALAKGADEAIHIEHDDAFKLEPLQIAQAISHSIAEQNFDLIITGVQSSDLAQGQTGIMIAELMDMPHVGMVVSASVDGDTLQVTRELEGGAHQQWNLPTPCLLSVQGGINHPRFAGVKGRMTAKKRKIESVSMSDTAAQLDVASMDYKTMAKPPIRDNMTLLTGESAEVATQLATLLKEIKAR